MASAMGSALSSAVLPASISTPSMASVAYATEESASEESTAKATGLLRRSSMSAVVASGGPKIRLPRTRPRARALRYCSRPAPRVASSSPAPR